MPCIPDANGVLRCYVPPTSGIDGGVPSACVPAGGPCSINGDCCVGSMCIEPVGSTQGVCGTATPPPGAPPVDGGTADAPTLSCAAYGQACVTNGDCCNDVTCWNGRCMNQIIF
jgi:hypothetical protein